MDPAKYCPIDAITLLCQLIKTEVSGVTKVEGSSLDSVHGRSVQASQENLLKYPWTC
jgi:hypothetical protein